MPLPSLWYFVEGQNSLLIPVQDPELRQHRPTAYRLLPLPVLMPRFLLLLLPQLSWGALGDASIIIVRNGSWSLLELKRLSKVNFSDGW